MLILSGYVKLFLWRRGRPNGLFLRVPSLPFIYPPAHHLPSSFKSLLIKRQDASLSEFTSVQNKAEAVRV